MIKSRLRAVAKLAPMAHQKVSLAHDKTTPIVFDTSDPGCVSCDTEYLTPTGWRRFDKYVPGDLVAQFHPSTREIEFVAPLEYIKRPCEQFVAIQPVRGTSQLLSPEHRVLYYDQWGRHGVCSAAEYMDELHRVGPHRQGKKFCTTFTVRASTSFPLNDAQLRVMVAVIADGHFQNGNNRCVVRIKKARKIERLHSLLKTADIIYKERVCGGADTAFRVFTFDAPRHDKEFTTEWWQANQSQLEIIADEIPHWDSAEDPRTSNGTRFSTFVEASADFAQYAFAASKRPASTQHTFRNRRAENRGLMVEHTVHARRDDGLIGPGRATSVKLVPSQDGFKYCFEVPSSFLLLRHNGHIFATGNTGKTAVRIWSYSERRRKRRAGCLLILAPRSLLTSAWANDFEKFAPDMKVSVATAENREKAFAAEADVYITNVDAVKWLGMKPKTFFAKFTDLVIDESPAYKHHASQRSRAAVKISKHFKHRACLTGTPNGNSICDVWHQALLLDGGQRLGPSFYAFRASVSVPEQVGRKAEAVRWVDKDGAEEAVFGLLADITVRHKFEDCVDIPPHSQQVVAYKLPLKVRKVYDQMERDHLLPLLKGNFASVVTAVNAAAVGTKLLQIGSGAVYDNDGSVHDIDDGRIKLVLDLAEARRHSLVFYLWDHQREKLIAEAEARGLKYCAITADTSDKARDAVVDAYQAGMYRIMFAHPINAAHGLTLTRGTATIWPGPTANLEHWVQGNKRQHRIGQTQKTETLVVVADTVVEQRVYFDLLMGKNKRMTTFLDLFASMTEDRRLAA